MTGVMRAPGGSHAFLYTDGEVRDLGTFGGTRSFGYGMSDNGMVTGDATPASDPTSRAFIYANGAMRDLGTLPGGSASIGLGVNNFGQVTGSANTRIGETHAMLADSRGMRDLGTLGGKLLIRHRHQQRGPCGGRLEPWRRRVADTRLFLS